MKKKKYVYNNQKRMSIRLPKRFYNKLKRKAEQSHLPLSSYIRRILTTSNQPIFSKSSRDEILKSNQILDKKLDKLKNFPWRESENLNQLTRSVNSNRVPSNMGSVIRKAEKETVKVEKLLESMKK